MKETEITIERLTPAGTVNGHFILGNFFFKDSAKFNEEEVSTLKTMISNLHEGGYLTMYDLVEQQKFFVDKIRHPFATPMIHHKQNPDELVSLDEFAAWIQEKYDEHVSSYLSRWDFKFNGAFVWDDEECVRCMFEDLGAGSDFNVVFVQIEEKVIGTFLDKTNAENVMRSYDGYYPQKMEIKERATYGSEIQTLYKILSLLNL